MLLLTTFYVVLISGGMAYGYGSYQPNPVLYSGYREHKQEEPYNADYGHTQLDSREERKQYFVPANGYEDVPTPHFNPGLGHFADYHNAFYGHSPQFPIGEEYFNFGFHYYPAHWTDFDSLPTPSAASFQHGTRFPNIHQQHPFQLNYPHGQQQTVRPDGPQGIQAATGGYGPNAILKPHHESTSTGHKATQRPLGLELATGDYGPDASLPSKNEFHHYQVSS